jgi:hypothetical protein
MTSAAILARLAGLHPIDRKWLLENVPTETRARLAAALETVQEEPAGNIQQTSSHRDARYAIAGAPAADVANALQSEPAWLTAAVMRMEDWPWFAVVLKSMPLMLRPQPTIGVSTALKPALASAILEGFARRLPPYDESLSPPQRRAPLFDDLVQQLGSRRPTPEPRA